MVHFILPCCVLPLQPLPFFLLQALATPLRVSIKFTLLKQLRNHIHTKIWSIFNKLTLPFRTTVYTHRSLLIVVQLCNCLDRIKMHIYTCVVRNGRHPNR